MKWVIVTGATSAIARSVIRSFNGRYNMILCARDKEKLSAVVTDTQARFNVEVKGALIDMTDLYAAEKQLKKMIAEYDIAGIILAHGAMGKELDMNYQELDSLMTTNTTSIIHLCNVYVREYKKRSFLCVIGSIAGERGKGRNLVYNATKGALSIYLDGLRQVAKHVRITEVRPGWIDTRMTYGYINSPLVASRERAGKDIIKGIERSKRVVYTPFFWRYIMLVLRNLPNFIFDRLGL